MTVDRSSTLVSIAIEQNIGLLSIQRGDTNALNEGLLAELDRALRSLFDSPDTDTIVITGTTDIFMAGADLPFFARCLLQGNIERILAFTQSCHATLELIERSPKPVVAWVRAAALGAGLELALACEKIVAENTAKFSLPETGLGIYPGMGGMQRLSRRIGRGLAKWMVGTGAILPAAAAHEIGLVDALVSAPANCAAVLAALHSSPPTRSLSPRYQSLEELFGGHALSRLMVDTSVTSTDPQCVRALAQLRSKAPRAIELADQFIDQGAALPLPDAIALEYRHLEEIFRTEDARSGILSFGKTKPAFVGR